MPAPHPFGGPVSGALSYTIEQLQTGFWSVVALAPTWPEAQATLVKTAFTTKQVPAAFRIQPVLNPTARLAEEQNRHAASTPGVALGL